MIFVDSGAWFAVSVPRDSNHTAASSFITSNSGRAVCNVAIIFIDETAYSFYGLRGQQRQSLVFGKRVDRWCVAAL